MTDAIAPARRSRDPAPLARTLIVLLWVQIVAAAVAAAATLLAAEAAVGSPLGLGLDAATAVVGGVEGASGLVALVYLAAMLVGGFLSLKWIYRASLNAHALASGLDTRPAWAVGWFFVPFANLIKPFQALREAWQASVRAEGWRTVPTPALLRVWWGLWLLSNVLNTIAARAPTDPDDPAYRLGASFLAVSSLADIANNVAFLLIVRRLTALQTDALHRHVFD